MRDTVRQFWLGLVIMVYHILSPPLPGCSLMDGRGISGGKVEGREETNKQEKKMEASRRVCLLVDWLLNVPATCQCISGTDLLRQFYVLPH